MPRHVHLEKRDGACVKAKFGLPNQACLVVSFGMRQELEADTIVELYGCQGWVRHGDFSNIVCQRGQTLSCATSKGQLLIKAQGPLVWKDAEDVKTLHTAVRSGLDDAASAGADRVCVYLNFSLSIAGNTMHFRDGYFSVARALAIIFSKSCPPHIQEVNVCAQDARDCTELITACHELVLSGKMFPHTSSLPPCESMIAKNKELQGELDAMKEEMNIVKEELDEVEKGPRSASPDQAMIVQNKKLQDELDAVRKEMVELKKEMDDVRTAARCASPDHARRSHHQRRRAKQQREQIPPTPNFSD